MNNSTSAPENTTAFLLKHVPTLTFLVRSVPPYDPLRRWGFFDSLGVRAIDDLIFTDSPQPKTIVAYTDEPPYGDGVEVITLPTPVALERIFFHIQGITSLVLNPRNEVAYLSASQAGVAVTLPQGWPRELSIVRAEIPELLGLFSLPARQVKDPLARAERAYRDNALFQAYALAKKVREDGGSGAHRAWFFELMSLSFLGMPHEAMALYEEYPQRGASEPEAQLVNARYRLLLKQLNEARTILHGLTFHDELGSFASCELARSYVMSGEFDRAIDLASAAIQKDPSYVESHLVRGIASRGLSYSSGDEDGLKDALKDLELVAKKGDFSAPEASFHAGTVFGRLGALEEAEVALRQSLFRRDRYASRDALVRVLCAAGKMDWAHDELELVCALAPSVTQSLQEEVESHFSKGSAPSAEPHGEHGLWGTDLSRGVSEARSLLRSWGVPLVDGSADCAVLDDFINRYAPAGDFLSEGPGAPLSKAGEATVVRALTLYVGDILSRDGKAQWESGAHKSLVLVTAHGARIPLEGFVQERLILGASGDNFSSLESLAVDILGVPFLKAGVKSDWWQVASEKEIAEFAQEIQWGRAKLDELGAKLSGGLSDLEELDRVIEHAFEPGGMLQESAESVLGEDLDRFVASIGLLVGFIVADLLKGVWYRHEQPEGISVVTDDLGRIFPIARMQRRAYLSSAADSPQKLASFGFGVGAAVITDRIRKGVYTDRAHIVTALQELLPGVAVFSESELDGVVTALLESARSS
jgi:tetratricopeptide (TPR) repeat protein